MHYIRIKQKTSQGYTPYDVVNNANNVDYYYGNQTLEHYLQNIANNIISPRGAYWEFRMNLYGASFNIYKMCNVGKFHVIVYAMKSFIGDSYTQVNKIKICVSNDGGYTWKDFSYNTDSDPQTELVRIFDAKIALTSVGYKLVVLTGREATLSTYYNGTVYSYAFYFINNSADGVSYNMVGRDYSNTFNNDGGHAPILIEAPQGFMAISYKNNNGTKYNVAHFDSYLYSAEFSRYGTANGANYIPSPQWNSMWGEDSKISTETGDYGLIYAKYDNALDRIVGISDCGLRFCNPYYKMESLGCLDVFSDYNYIDSTNAFGRTISLIYDQDGYYISIVYEIEEDPIIYRLPELTEDNTWQYIIGNNYRLYLISTQGDVAYTDNITIIKEGYDMYDIDIDDFVIVNQREEAVADTDFITLKSYAPLVNAHFNCDNENCDIVGVVFKSGYGDMYNIIHTHTGVLG